MASAIEEYLETYDTVQRFAECNVDVADYLLELSRLMRSKPREALAAIRSCWPTAEQMLSFIGGSLNADDELSRRWANLPDKFKSGLLKTPDTVGEVDVGESIRRNPGGSSERLEAALGYRYHNA